MPYRVEVSRLVDLFDRRFAKFLTAWEVACRYRTRRDDKVNYHIWRLYPFYQGSEHDYHLVFVVCQLPNDEILIENDVASDVFHCSEVRNIWASFFERAREVTSEVLLRKIYPHLVANNILPELNVIRGVRRVQELTTITPSGRLVSIEFLADGRNIFLKPQNHPPIRIEAATLQELVSKIKRSISLMMF
jgi:hypothetical protein